MIKSVTAVAAVLGLAGLAAACSSSPSTTTGTEHFSSVLQGQAALGNSFPLTYTGPVATKGTFNTSGPAPRVGQEVPFKTDAGNLELKVAKIPVNTQGGNPKTCVFKADTVVDYTVVGSKSTGKFAGASGSGTVTVIFSGTGPRLANGSCNESSSAEPIASTAYGSFTGIGPLTVRT